MPSIPRPYDLVNGIRDSAEAERWLGVQAAVMGAIQARSISAEMIEVGTITSAEIAADTITAANIEAGAITASELAANSVTASKINVATLSAITADLGTVNAGHISGADITLGSGTPRIYGDDTGIKAIGDQASYRFHDPDLARVGAARANTFTGSEGPVLQIELVAYPAVPYADDLTSSALRCRDRWTDDEFSFVRVFASNQVSGSDAYANVSDRKLKSNVRDVANPLEVVGALRPRVFDRHLLAGREGKLKRTGFVAQEVEKVLPDLVDEIDVNGSPVKVMRETGILPYAVGAIQELADRVGKLEKR
jgi:hypothetical protein